MVTLKPKIIVLAEALFAVLVWGGTFVATKFALQEVQPVTVVWLRFFIGVWVLGGIVIARGQFALPRGREWGYFALLGFLGITFHQWLQSNGLTTSQASTTAWIVSTSPIFIALLGSWILKERLGWMQTAGIALATIGMLLVVSHGKLANLIKSGFGEPGDILILISAINWAVFSIFSRSGLKSHPAARMMFYVMTFGWVFSCLLFFTGPGLQDVVHLQLDGWVAVAFLGVFGSGLAYIAWYDALQVLAASQVGVFLYIEPLVTLLVAALLLGEKITLASMLGGGIILFGVWLVNRSIRKGSP